MFQNWELFYKDFIKKRPKGVIPLLLIFLSWIYFCVSKLRQLLIKSKRPEDVVIVSIGNIVAGGTGKTPVTLMLAEQLNPYKTALLSRGYRSLAEKAKTPIKLSALHTAKECGDEPYLLLRNAPNLTAFVGRRRDLAADMAKKEGIKLILLDDGFQYVKLQRDFDVVVMDTHDPFGQGYLLPRGFLREKPKALERASLIILNHADHPDYTKVKEAVACFTLAPVVGVKIVPILDRSIAGKKVAIFCGIANPEYFEKTVKDLGGIIVNKHYLADHQPFEELGTFVEDSKAKGAELILCTEKDKVKLPENAFSVVDIKIRLSIIDGQKFWDQFIDKIKDQLASI